MFLLFTTRTIKKSKYYSLKAIFYSKYLNNIIFIENFSRLIEETQDCLEMFYYDYLDLRKDEKSEDLRVIGIGEMDKKYVGAIPRPNEIDVAEKIEKILKLRLNLLTICKLELYYLLVKPIKKKCKLNNFFSFFKWKHLSRRRYQRQIVYFRCRGKCI